MSETKEQMPGNTNPANEAPSVPSGSGRFFAPVNETLHLSGVSWERRRWELRDPEISEEHRLIVSTGAETWQYPVRKEVLVGTDENCHIILSGRKIMPIHLALNTDGELFWFRCLGIGGEILVDGVATQEGWLQGGEELRLGDARMFFMVPDRLRAQSRVPILYESTDIKDHSQVLEAVRQGHTSANDSCGHLQSVQSVQVAVEETLSQEQEVHPPQATNTKALWAAIVVFCLGVSAVLVAGGLHLRQRHSAKKKARAAQRVAARQASLVAFRNRQIRTQLDAQLVQVRSLMTQRAWKRAAALLKSMLAHNEIAVAPQQSSTATMLLSQVKREARAAAILDRAQRLSLKGKSTHARKVLALLKLVPKESASAVEAGLLRHSVCRELRHQIKMIRVMIQTQRHVEARVMLRSWLLAVRTPQAAQALELTQAHLDAQQLASRLGGIDLSEDRAAAPTPPRKDEPRPLRAMKIPPAPFNGRDKDAVEWLSLGHLAFRMGRVAKAIRSFQRVKTLTRSATLLRRAEASLQRALRYQRGEKDGLRAARRKQFQKAIPLLEQAIEMNRSFGRETQPTLRRTLAAMIALRGRSFLRQKRYVDAYRSFVSAKQTLPRNANVRSGLASLQARAKELMVEARVLRTVDGQEYKQLLRKITMMTAPGIRVHRKARQLLGHR